MYIVIYRLHIWGVGDGNCKNRDKQFTFVRVLGVVFYDVDYLLMFVTTLFDIIELGIIILSFFSFSIIVSCKVIPITFP